MFLQFVTLTLGANGSFSSIKDLHSTNIRSVQFSLSLISWKHSLESKNKSDNDRNTIHIAFNVKFLTLISLKCAKSRREAKNINMKI